MPPKRGRPRKQVTTEDVPKGQVKLEGKVKIVPRAPGRQLRRIGRQPERAKPVRMYTMEEYESEVKAKKPRKRRTKALEEDYDEEYPVERRQGAAEPFRQGAAEPFRQGAAEPSRRGRVVSSNYNQVGSLGAPVQIRPAFPGVQKQFMVQEYPRNYSNLSASVNPGIPQSQAYVSAGIPSGMNFLQQPGPPRELYTREQLEAILKAVQATPAGQFTDKQVEARGMAPVSVQTTRDQGVNTEAFANVPEIAAAPPSQGMAVMPLVQRQAMEMVPSELQELEMPPPMPASVFFNERYLLADRALSDVRNRLVQQSASVQSENNASIMEWAQNVPPARVSVLPTEVDEQEDVESVTMPQEEPPLPPLRVPQPPKYQLPAWIVNMYEEKRPSRYQGNLNDFLNRFGADTDDTRLLQTIGRYLLRKPLSTKAGVPLPSGWPDWLDQFGNVRDIFDKEVIERSDTTKLEQAGWKPFRPYVVGSGLSGGFASDAWYRGTTPTMRAAGDKRLMAQYGPQMEAQRHMEQRVDYLGYAGTGLVRTTPVYEAGDVGWAEPPKGAATINTASYRGRAAVAIRDPNTLKVGQKATTSQTLAQQRLASMYEQGHVGRPRLQMSGQPYFDNDVNPVSVTAAPAQVMPNAIFSKLRGSPYAI